MFEFVTKLFKQDQEKCVQPFVYSPKKEIKMESPKFTFTTREEYLVYKAEWKERLAEAIKAYRKLKNEYKDAQRAYSKASGGLGYWDMSKEQRAECDKIKFPQAWKAKEVVQKLFEERQLSKIEAGRQRELRLRQAA
jgi:hypothetical protein